VKDFAKSLKTGQQFAIEWRLVDTAVAEADVAWDTYVGTVTDEIDEDNDTCTVTYAGVEGDFDLPPPAQYGSWFVEIRSLEKSRERPTLASLGRKRDREERPLPAADGGRQILQLVEAIRGEDIKRRVEICPGLRVTEDESEVWRPFRLHEWIAILRAVGDDAAKRNEVVTRWRLELLQTTTDIQINFLGRDAAIAVAQYNAARDQLMRWFHTVPELTLSTKSQFELAYHLLFSLLQAMVSINYGFTRGLQLKANLVSEFSKSATTLDISHVLANIFRPDRSSGKPVGKTPQRHLGTDKQESPSDRQCRYCKKWHSGPKWDTHRCK